MAELVYNCTYTNQLSKKRKIWADGSVSLRREAQGIRLQLLDESGGNVYRPRSFSEVNMQAMLLGDEYMLDGRYLLQVDTSSARQRGNENQPPPTQSVAVSVAKQTTAKPQQSPIRGSSLATGYTASGLVRKRFVPPRPMAAGGVAKQPADRNSWLDLPEQEAGTAVASTAVTLPVETVAACTASKTPPAVSAPRLPRFKRPLATANPQGAQCSASAKPAANHSFTSNRFMVFVPAGYNHPHRSQCLRGRYPDATSYAMTMAAAVAEELQLGLGEVMVAAEKIGTELARGAAVIGAQSGRAPRLPRIEEPLVRRLRSRGIALYSRIQAVRSVSHNKKESEFKARHSKRAKWRSRSNGNDYGGDGDDCDGTSNDDNKREDDDSRNLNNGETAAATRLFIRLPQGQREHSTAYGRFDVWILWKEGSECTRREPAVPPRPSRYPFPWREGNIECPEVHLFYSDWHGPSGDGLLQMLPLCGTAHALQLFDRTGSELVGIRALNAQSLLTIVELLTPIGEQANASREEKALTFPILCAAPAFNSLLQSPIRSLPSERLQPAKLDSGAPSVQPLPVISDSERFNLVQQLQQKHQLNADQFAMLEQASMMFTGKPSKDIFLVHGVFGAGKSTLLVAICTLVHLVARMTSSTQTCSVRVLISSNTNTAVDRVLAGLVQAGVTRIARVGSAARVDRQLLPYMVYSNDSINCQEGIKRQLLKMQEHHGQAGLDANPVLERALKEAEDGTFLARQRQRLRSADIIGVTCASACSSILRSEQCAILVLDECSQMLEATSLLPLACSGARKLILVGDPKQLPPPIAMVPFRSPAAKGAGGEAFSLDLTLFQRLAHVGHTPILLRTQYRCHPIIGNLCNSLFYDGALLNGVADSDRAAIVPGLPPILFIDVTGGSEAYRNASFVNDVEARAMAEFVRWLLRAHQGQIGWSIGAINLYKEQARVAEQSISRILAAAPAPAPSTAQQSDATDAQQSADVQPTAEPSTADQGSSSKTKPSLDNFVPDVQVATVDAFQGAEKNVILLSTVRTQALGFTTQPQRINVALSRAKNHLVIFGRQELLRRSPLWARVLEAADTNGKVLPAEYIRDYFHQLMGCA